MAQTRMKTLSLNKYRPRSMLVTPQSQVLAPRFPVIDAHNHLGLGFGGDWLNRPIGDLISRLDEAHVHTYVDLDGGWGEDILNEHLDKIKAKAPDRFKIFGGVDWKAWAEHGDHFGVWAARQFEAQVKRGAEGLKIWKVLGLHILDQHQKLVAVDDPRLDPIWATAGELHQPVLIHVADPVAFFEPLDAHNERWEELVDHMDWYFPSPPFPPFLSIVNGLAAVVQRHPETTFIGAHVGCYAENLAWVGALLDRCPNFFVDIGARIGELGRQPYSTRKFFMKYPDRILFGTDAGPDLDTYRIYYRFLETEDEYFNYNPGEIPGQGRWFVYGLHLPEDVLQRVYFKNAAAILIING